MKILFKEPESIITVDSKGALCKKGKQMNDIAQIHSHSILVEDGIIKDFIPNEKTEKLKVEKTVNLSGKTIFPGLVECHTHTVFAGNRADEFRMKLSGVDYEKIAASGGGIIKTVKAVRSFSFEELLEISKPRIEYFISQGVTTLEIKSGYGLTYYDEIKLLQVINHLNKIYPIDIIPTFLGAHTYPPEYKNDHEQYIELVAKQLIPYIAENKLAEFCDVFCEATAFSVEETRTIFEAAQTNGLKLKLHTDQFNSLGGIDLALEYKCTSIDHLEVISEEEIDKIVKHEIATVLLPGVSFFLNYNFAPARKLIDSGATVALSTDFNPGSSHIQNLNFIMSLGALKMGMTIEETISAVTINAAYALNKSDSIGSLEIGKKADFMVLNSNEFADIVYNVGKNINYMTVKNGEVIWTNSNGN